MSASNASSHQDFEDVRQMLEVDTDPDVKEITRRSIKDEFADALLEIGEAWEVDVMEGLSRRGPLEINFSDEHAEISEENEIFLLYPELFYKDALENSTSRDVMDRVELAYPVPVTEIREEAGHYVSDIPVAEPRIVEDYETFVVSELFGAVALGQSDPAFLRDQIARLERNLDVVREMYGKEHSEYIESLEPDERLEVLQGRLLGAAETDAHEEEISRLRSHISSIYTEWLEGAPALSNDGSFDDYSRHYDSRPPTYSEWFLQKTFEFIRPLVEYLDDPAAEIGPVEALEESAEILGERRAEFSGMKDLNTDRADVLIKESAEDRAYLNSRLWARDIIEDEEDVMAQMVRLPNDVLVDAYQEQIRDRDLRIVDDYNLDLAAETGSGEYMF